ncbi:hypothetical protein DERF_008227 [Dermatophagoides farinae]|uniref:P-type domain-containing protein n=1 Tax=Dermatophagoides farinae TaxID=6954 RepID=A0A922I2S1_DERFA|nr:hypothetical protein DERF_008227 [Dermatophagoides farinae]
MIKQKFTINFIGIYYKHFGLTIRNEDRIDCNPDPPISKNVCEQRGCCWKTPGNDLKNLSSKALPNLNVPYCYYGENYIGYKIEKHSKNLIQLKRNRSSGFARDIENINIEIHELNDKVIRLKFIDANKKRYEVPIPKLNLPSTHHHHRILDYQLIHVTSRLPSKYIYGLGEHRAPFRKNTNWKRYTQWTRDQYPALYGNHPFYLTVEDESPKKSASGVFLFNSNAMDIITQPSPAITFRTIGGILDFFVFFGPKPEDVISQYQNLIGLPAMPPFWSLGYQQCRYGYNNFTNLNATYTRTRAAGIPMDVQWTDIDAFNSNNDFTYDHKRFKELPDFINNVLHPNGQKFIPMFDCGISSGESAGSYKPFDSGVELDVFVKNSSNKIFRGKVWNGKSTVWPDFSHPNATEYWMDMFAEYHQTIAFDGAWLDMNEPSNFYDGEEHGCPESEIENPQYVPGMTDDSLTLRHKTLCMTARHYDDQLHYNLHNLYSLSMAMATNAALTKLNKRPFIISRATAPGHGHWAYHWNGDILSDWSSMRWTIPSILNFNMFGIPMVGADICGFGGNTVEELCIRWYQLGAFYSFARNHNDIHAIDQDPAALGESVIKAARSSLQYRYRFLAHLYTLFYHVHKNGGTVLRPMFFEFPHDEHTYEIETQFMWGDSVLIAPILYPNQTQHKIYLPKGTWYNRKVSFESQGQYITMNDSYDDIDYVFVRGGSIIPTQEPHDNTELMKTKDFLLIVALDNQTSYAKGSLYWDSGDKYINYPITMAWISNNTKHKFSSIFLVYQSCQLSFKLNGHVSDPRIIRFNYDEQTNILTVETKLPIYNQDSSSHDRIHYQFEWIME